MKTFQVLVVTREYRTVYVEAESAVGAEDKAWADLDNILNTKSEDYYTELFVEGEQP